MHGVTQLPEDRFSWNSMLSIFRKSVEKIQTWLKSDRNKGYFTWRPQRIFIISRPVLLRTRNISDKSCRDNENTRLVFKTFFFFRESCRLWDNVENNIICISIFSHNNTHFTNNFTTLQLVSTLNSGCHQAMIQEHECLRELSTIILCSVDRGSDYNSCK
jgi:hypothetical protein